MYFNMVTNPEGKCGRESITQFLTTLTVDYGDLRMKWAGSTQDSEEPRLSIILKYIAQVFADSNIQHNSVVYFNMACL